MDSILLYRMIGVVLIFLGILLAVNPELVSHKPVPEDTFKAVERRIWWGLLIGVGMLLQFHQQWLPWQATVSATGATLLVGLLIARLIGILLDGSVMKQWVNVGIEIILLIPFIWWYMKVRV